MNKNKVLLAILNEPGLALLIEDAIDDGATASDLALLLEETLSDMEAFKNDDIRLARLFKQLGPISELSCEELAIELLVLNKAS